MAEKKVSVRLVAENGRQVRAELEGVGDAGARSFQRMSKEVDTAGTMLKRLAGIAAGALSIRQVAQYADTWTDLRSRVDLATGSQEKGALVMERLSEMARRTYSSLESTTESWLSNATALRELGMSTAESLDFTEALNNAMVVSGAKAERAASVQNALSKAMALGSLQGVNLNTVIQTGGRVAELLAEELGTTTSGLREMGKQGKITGDVIRTALVGNLELLREEADSMPATISDAFTLIGNAALVLVGTWDQLLGVSSTVADVLILVADNLERLASIALAFAAFMAGRWVLAFVAARVSTFSLATALVTLRAALIRTGIGAIIVATGELIHQFSKLVKGAGGFGAALGLLGDVAKAVWDGIKDTVSSFGDNFRAMRAEVEKIWLGLMAFLSQKWADFLGTIAPTFNAITDQIGSDMKIDWFGAESRADLLASSARNAGHMAERYRQRAAATRAGAWAGVGEAMQALSDAVNSVDDDAADALNDAIDTLETKQSEQGKKGGGKRAKEEKHATDQLIQSLQRELVALKETDPIKKKMLEYSEQLKDATAGQRAEVERLVRSLDDATHGFDAITRKMAEYMESSKRLGGEWGDVFVGAFNRAEDAFAEFVTRGKLSFSDLISSMAADMARLAARQHILGPLAGLVTGWMGGDKLSSALRAAGAPVASFDGGGYTGHGPRIGGLDGKGGFMAMLHPNETVVDHMKGGRGGGAQGVVVGVDPKNGNITAYVDQRIREALPGAFESFTRHALPGAIRNHLGDPRAVG